MKLFAGKLTFVLCMIGFVAAVQAQSSEMKQAYRALYKGNFQKVRTLHDTILKRSGPSPLLTQLLGQMYYAKGMLVQAREVYQRGLRTLPSTVHPWLWNNMGNVALRQGNKAKAIQAYIEALRLNPRYERARFNLEKLQRKKPPKKRPNKPPPPRKKKRQRKKRRRKPPPRKQQRSKKRPKADKDDTLRLKDYDRFLPLYILRKMNRKKR